MTSCEPVAAFCSSDEEGEDENMLLFLPIAPEIEDPEVNIPYTLLNIHRQLTV